MLDKHSLALLLAEVLSTGLPTERAKLLSFDRDNESEILCKWARHKFMIIWTGNKLGIWMSCLFQYFKEYLNIYDILIEINPSQAAAILYSYSVFDHKHLNSTTKAMVATELTSQSRPPVAQMGMNTKDAVICSAAASGTWEFSLPT